MRPAVSGTAVSVAGFQLLLLELQPLRLELAAASYPPPTTLSACTTIHWVSTVPRGMLAVNLLLFVFTAGLLHGCYTTLLSPDAMLQYSLLQLLDLNNHSLPLHIGVIKQLGLLRRPRYVHRGSSRRFVYYWTERSVLSLCSQLNLSQLDYVNQAPSPWRLKSLLSLEHKMFSP